MSQDRGKALRDALEPFARLAGALVDGDADDGTVIGVTVADLRRARAALAMQEPASERTPHQIKQAAFEAEHPFAGEPAPCEHCRDAYQAGVDFAMGALPASSPAPTSAPSPRCYICGEDAGCLDPQTCSKYTPASASASYDFKISVGLFPNGNAQLVAQVGGMAGACVIGTISALEFDAEALANRIAELWNAARLPSEPATASAPSEFDMVQIPRSHLKEAMRFYPPFDHDTKTRLIRDDLLTALAATAPRSGESK